MPLSYSTVKLVRIQDSYLATLHYAFMAGIFGTSLPSLFCVGPCCI